MSPTYSQKSWSLNALYPSHNGSEINAAFAELEAQTAEFEKKRSLLTNKISQSELLTIAAALESLHRIAYRLAGYAGLWFAADTQNQEALGMVMRTEQLVSEISNRTLFFSLWWKDLPDETALPLI